MQRPHNVSIDRVNHQDPVYGGPDKTRFVDAVCNAVRLTSTIDVGREQGARLRAAYKEGKSVYKDGYLVKDASLPRTPVPSVDDSKMDKRSPKLVISVEDRCDRTQQRGYIGKKKRNELKVGDIKKLFLDA